MVFRFGDCTLDTQRHQLQRAGQPVRVRTKAFQVLRYLLEHRDRMVLKLELCEQVWPQAFISDATLESTVRAVRQAIGDSGRTQQLIQTVYGDGYRFIAAVEVCTDYPPGTAADAARSSPVSGSAQPPGDDRHTALVSLTPGSAGSHDSPWAPALAEETELIPHNGAAEGDPERPAVPSPVWEQKLVAVLAVEYTYPATGGEGTASEPWRVASRWEQALVTQVQGFGGVVVQRSPSLLLVAFGIPRTLDQLPQRAVQTALRLRQLVAEGADREPCPVLRLVGHWGALLVDVQARDPAAQLRALGDTLAWPVRLLGQAAPGEILLSPALGPLIEAVYEVQARKVSLQGGQPGWREVYVVAGNRPRGARRRRQGRRPLTPFVSRDQELATLRDRLRRVEGGRGQVVGVMGEPGVGKSRLCDEFLRGVPARRWLVLATQGTAYSQAIPYLPLMDLLKSYFHLDDRDDEATIRDRVTTHLHGLDDRLTAAAPALLALLEVPVEDPAWQALEASQRRQRTFDALKQVLVRESQEQPVLLVVEDLHWIDAETQACLDALVESLPSAQLLVVVTYRPDYQHGWGHKPAYTLMRLDPLPPAGADAFLRALLGDAPGLAPLTPLLIACTEGNPFFLEESVRTLVETGVLVGERGHYRLTQASPTLAVPATVQAVLAARIDRLPPEAKQVLHTAAVIVPEVPLALLQAVADLPESQLRLGLTHLQAAEFLYERRLFPEIEYTFTHALTQQVAYETLLQERRRTLHAHIVEALEALAGERSAEPVDRLAYHALRGEVWEPAVAYCRQVGTRAQNRGANREATSYYEQALGALGHLPDHPDGGGLGIDLRLAWGRSLHLLGEYRRYLALLGEAEVQARALDDRRRLGWVLAQIARVRRQTGDADGALAAGHQALELAAALGDGALQAEAAIYLGQVYWSFGDFGRAAALLRRNVEAAARETGTPSLGRLIGSQAWLARTLSVLGAFAEGRRYGEAALRLAIQEGRGNLPILARGYLGELYLAQGDLEPAIRVLEQGLALCRASDNRNDLRTIVAGLGFAYALQGRLAEGQALLEEGISEGIGTGSLLNVTYRVAWLSEVCRLAGQGEEAWQRAHQALALARQLKARGGEALALHQIGLLHAHGDPPDAGQAEAYYGQALALAKALGMRPLQAHGHRSLGTLYAAISCRDQAQTELSAAIALYRSMDMTFWLPRAEGTLAEVEGR